MKQDTAEYADTIEGHRAAVDAIAQSAAFRRSPRLREMLLFIANSTLSGCPENLTETRIAEKVFGRPGYNPSEDNLVRVSARQLRSKIAEYYETEGRHDQVAFDIPKGGYSAVFNPRRDFASLPEHAPPNTVAAQPASVRGVSRALALVLAGLIVCLAFFAAWLWNENRQLRAAIPAPTRLRTLFDGFAPVGTARTDIVITDSALVLLEQLMHEYVSVQDYASYRYLRSTPKFIGPEGQGDLLSTLRTRQISSLADLRIVSAILQRYPKFAPSITIRHARNIQVRDFDTSDNLVFIGSSRSNPWVSLFEKPLWYHLQTKYGSPCFENVHAAVQEQKLYCLENSAEEQGTDYARIAVLHNANGRGRVLLISGADMESTEAAGDFFLNPQSVDAVLNALHARRVSDLPDYELLLRTYSIGGSGRSPQIVRVHRL